MAPSSSSSSSTSPSPSSSSKSPPSPPPQPSLFTPIQECDKEEHDEDDDETPATGKSSSTVEATPTKQQQHHQHHATPLHKGGGSKKSSGRSTNDEAASVSCNKCRPNSREKISVVPLDSNNGVSANPGKLSSPNGIFRSIISSITRRSPKPDGTTAAREEQWKIAVAELSHKLIQATRRRDEAVSEASRLKNSMAELEKKLTKLEHHCQTLKLGLDECSSIGSFTAAISSRSPVHRRRYNKETVDNFLAAVSEARNFVRLLARSLAAQLRHVGGGGAASAAKVCERIAILSQPATAPPGAPAAKSPRAVVLINLEAILNKVFYEDFETASFQRGCAAVVLDPTERRESNRESYTELRRLTWEEVLCRGTRHFSEEFSGFCDRKMSDVVSLLGWTRAWPEPLLQAFFGAAKWVWLVHLLANSVQPGFDVFRVDRESRFDPGYMEDVGVDKTRRLVPSVVRMMVAPGFYVGGTSVVKCKVLCRYNNNYANTNSNIIGINSNVNVVTSSGVN